MREMKMWLSDGTTAEVMVYEPDNPVGVIHILHGMAEHMKRYEQMALFFYKRGYQVILNNHTGHGFDIDDDARGHFDSIEQVAQNAHEIFETLSVQHVPRILFGHSMGSIIARKYAAMFPEFNALILSGTSYYDASQAASKRLLKTMMRAKGPEERSELVNKIAIRHFNRKIKPMETPSDWLSFNKENVKSFLDDPFTGFNVSLNVLYEILNTMQETQKKSVLKKMDHAMPILLVAGEEDAFSNYGKGIKALGKHYKKNGFEHVTIQMYDHARHEVLMERPNDEVVQNIYDWLQRQSLEWKAK